MHKYLDDMLATHRTKLLEHLANIEPPCDDDDTNPYITFWAMVEMGAELHSQMRRNENYYASGKCGGCETCGLPPFDMPYNAGGEYIAYMRTLFVVMDEHDRKVMESSTSESSGGEFSDF